MYPRVEFCTIYYKRCCCIVLCGFSPSLRTWPKVNARNDKSRADKCCWCFCYVYYTQSLILMGKKLKNASVSYVSREGRINEYCWGMKNARLIVSYYNIYATMWKIDQDSKLLFSYMDVWKYEFHPIIQKWIFKFSKRIQSANIIIIVGIYAVLRVIENDSEYSLNPNDY